MKSYYSAVDSLSKKAGGPYCFSSILIKRVRQLVKGSLGGFRSEGFDPVNTAFEEYKQDKLQVLEGGVPLELVQRKGKKGKK
ncbi:MAG: DNA-directed RNA polymerase subunit omega [Candidatus Brocadiales bacterium]